MGLMDAQTLRELFAIDDQIDGARFERSLAAASARVRSWVGDDAYTDALTIPADDQERADNLAYAEAHLAMGYAILGINTALRPTGVVRTEKVEGNVSIQYHSPAEVAALQQQYFDTAEQIARAYLLSDGTPGAPAVVEED